MNWLDPENERAQWVAFVGIVIFVLFVGTVWAVPA